MDERVSHKRQISAFFESPPDDPQTTVPKTTIDKDANSFLKFYRSLPEKPKDLVRFFERGEYYTVHEEDAELIAKEFFNTTKVIKTWGNKNTGSSFYSPRKGQKVNAMTSPHQASVTTSNASSSSDEFTYVTINRGYQFETILRVLLHEKRYRVEIYSVGEDRKWFLKKKGSPGNLSELEDLLYANADMQEPNILLAIRIGYEQGHRTVGAAFIDAILKKIGVCQMLDNDQLTNLESLIIQCGAKECYCFPFDEKDADSRKLKELLQKCELVVTEMKKTDFDTSNIEQDLKRLLGEKRFNSIKMTLIDDKFAMSATACLLHGLQLLGDSSNFGTYKLFRYDLSQYMRLDNAAINALNILPNPREPNQSHNLYGLLNRCRTAMGSRKLLQWLKQPLLDVTQIKKRQDLVHLFYEDDNLCKELRTKCLKRIPDLERMTKKIQRGRANLQDCVIIYQFIQKLPEIIDALKRTIGDQTLLNEKFTAPFERLHKDLSGFENLVEETIDLEMVEEGEYVINPSFDDELQDIANKKKRIVKKIKEREDEVRIALGDPSSFKIDNDKTHGWFFRISRKDEKCITGKSKEKIYTILQPISKAGIKFQDAEMRTLSEQYLELCALYSKKSADLVKEIMNIVASYLPVFEEVHELIAELDVYTSFAEVSYSAPYPYVRPNITPAGGNIILKKARHPVMEVLPDMTFIPNDVSLVRGKSTFQIITGPNMGGKSTYIRQVGVIVLMAQIGCFVPCEEAEISVCDAILARVGAGDSQLRGVSTFMAEMLETATILHTATEKSLIIIDELGRGTSTYDGFGLAWAISEHIAKKIQALCLFATHFHELTQLEEEIPTVKNLHVEAHADEKKGLVLLYEVKPGPTDQSFGIHVAKVANFPPQVVQIAEQKANELENFDNIDKNTNNNFEDSIENSEQKEGEKLIETYLKEFASLPLDTLQPSQIQEYLRQLKEKIDSTSNRYIKTLLSKWNSTHS